MLGKERKEKEKKKTRKDRIRTRGREVKEMEEDESKKRNCMKSKYGLKKRCRKIVYFKNESELSLIIFTIENGTAGKEKKDKKEKENKNMKAWELK